MSQFTTNTDINTNTDKDIIVEMIDYPIESIPSHIIASQHFKDLLEIYPGETVFPFYNTSFSPSLEIHSQSDIDLIMESEYTFMFSHDARVEILRNIYKYWMEDPNSASIELPERDYSWFSNQILTLFEDRDSILVMTCMKMNYVELFDFILEYMLLSNMIYILKKNLFQFFLKLFNFYKYLLVNSCGVISGTPNFLASLAFPVSSSLSLTRTTKVLLDTLDPIFAPISLRDS